MHANINILSVSRTFEVGVAGRKRGETGWLHHLFISENENMCATVFTLPTAHVTTNTHVLLLCIHDHPTAVWRHIVQYIHVAYKMLNI